MVRRNTNQRKIVYDSLAYLGHASIDALIGYIQMHYENISLATIYRNISILQEEGMIKKVKLQGNDVLETVKQEHCHFVCERCGSIEDMEYNQNLFIDVAKGISMHQIKKCDVVFYGQCPKCEKENRENEVRM